MSAGAETTFFSYFTSVQQAGVAYVPTRIVKMVGGKGLRVEPALWRALVEWRRSSGDSGDEDRGEGSQVKL